MVFHGLNEEIEHNADNEEPQGRAGIMQKRMGQQLPQMKPGIAGRVKKER